MTESEAIELDSATSIAYISETAEPDGTRRISFFDAKTKTPLSHTFVTDEWIANNHPPDGAPTNANDT